METASEARRRYYQSTQDEVSDPDLWASLHCGEFTDEEDPWSKTEYSLHIRAKPARQLLALRSSERAGLRITWISGSPEIYLEEIRVFLGWIIWHVSKRQRQVLATQCRPHAVIAIWHPNHFLSFVLWHQFIELCQGGVKLVYSCGIPASIAYIQTCSCDAVDVQHAQIWSVHSRRFWVKEKFHKETRPVKRWGWLRFQTGGYFVISFCDHVSCLFPVRSWHPDDWCVSTALFLVVTVRMLYLLQPHNQSCYRSHFKILSVLTCDPMLFEMTKEPTLIKPQL